MINSCCPFVLFRWTRRPASQWSISTLTKSPVGQREKLRCHSTTRHRPKLPSIGLTVKERLYPEALKPSNDAEWASRQLISPLTFRQRVQRQIHQSIVCHPQSRVHTERRWWRQRRERRWVGAGGARLTNVSNVSLLNITAFVNVVAFLFFWSFVAFRFQRSWWWRTQLWH